MAAASCSCSLWQVTAGSAVDAAATSTHRPIPSRRPAALTPSPSLKPVPPGCSGCCPLQGRDFEGGTFRFQSGTPPLQLQPSAGMLLVYTADDSNVHSVEEVTRGERCTLTMWFTLDPQHQEDPKVG